MQIWNKLKFILSLLFWAVIWQLISDYIIKDPIVFPNSTNVIANAYELLFVNYKIIPDIIGSAERYIIAALIAMPMAIISAVLVSGNRKFKDLFYPIISLTYPLPKVAILPFLLLVFGIGDSAKIAMIVLGMYYLIFINIYVGLSLLLKGQLGDIVYTYRIEGINYWVHFLFKGSYRYFLTGLKAALGYGLTLVVVSEISLAKNGIGFFIWSTWDAFRVTDLYSALLILALIGYGINTACDYLINHSIGE